MDSFWNLAADLKIDNVVPRFIGLTATLRPEDVSDVMKRLGVSDAVVFRESCFRSGLNFKFLWSGNEAEAVKAACSLAIPKAPNCKVLVYATSIRMCEALGTQLQLALGGYANNPEY
jgi:superfamily II DNA helicase RecQ